MRSEQEPGQDGGRPTLGPPGRHRAGRRPAAPVRPVPRLLELPVALRAAELGVRPAAVVGMVLVLLLVAAVVGVRVWWAQRAAAPEPVPVVATSQAEPADRGERGDQGDSVPVTEEPAAASATGVASAPPVPLVLHVAGEVARPGLVRLPPGSRVEDALAAAGGATGRADTGRINLAREVTDGEFVWVPGAEEEPPALVGPAGGGGGAGDPGSAGGAGGDAQPLQVDLNTADRAALEELPGVGPVTAERIVAWREEHGRFSSAEELLEVSGIGERTLEQLRPHLTW